MSGSETTCPVIENYFQCLSKDDVNDVNENDDGMYFDPNGVLSFIFFFFIDFDF